MNRRWAPVLLTLQCLLACERSGEPASPPGQSTPAVQPEAPAESSGAVAPAVAPPPAQGPDPYRAAMVAWRAGDYATAAVLLRGACDDGDGAACFKLAELLRAGRAEPSTPGEADERTEQACRSGSSAACDALGH